MYVAGSLYRSFAKVLEPSLGALLGPSLGVSLGPTLGALLCHTHTTHTHMHISVFLLLTLGCPQDILGNNENFVRAYIVESNGC